MGAEWSNLTPDGQKGIIAMIVIVVVALALGFGLGFGLPNNGASGGQPSYPPGPNFNSPCPPGQSRCVSGPQYGQCKPAGGCAAAPGGNGFGSSLAQTGGLVGTPSMGAGNFGPRNAVGDAAASALMRAAAAERAARVAASNPVPTVDINNVARTGDAAEVAATTTALTAKYGTLPSGTGMIKPLFITSDSSRKPFLGKSKLPALGAPNGGDLSESSDDIIRRIAPEDAAKIDRAMELSATPAAFLMDDATADARKKNELMKALALNGAPDPSLEDILTSSTPYLATSAMILRATKAQGDIQRGMVLPTPMSQLYNPQYYGPRDAQPRPLISPLEPGVNGIPAGLANYMMDISCDVGAAEAAGCGFVEPF
jgi:hypothetical protein